MRLLKSNVVCVNDIPKTNPLRKSESLVPWSQSPDRSALVARRSAGEEQARRYLVSGQELLKLIRKSRFTEEKKLGFSFPLFLYLPYLFIWKYFRHITYYARPAEGRAPPYFQCGGQVR